MQRFLRPRRSVYRTESEKRSRLRFLEHLLEVKLDECGSNSEGESGRRVGKIGGGSYKPWGLVADRVYSRTTGLPNERVLLLSTCRSIQIHFNHLGEHIEAGRLGRSNLLCQNPYRIGVAVSHNLFRPRNQMP